MAGLAFHTDGATYWSDATAPQARKRSMKEQLGMRLRAIRMEQGLTLRALAARADISPSMLCRRWTGKIHPSVTTLYSLVSLLGVSLDKLLELTPTESHWVSFRVMSRMGTMARYTNEMRERAVRMLAEVRSEHPHETAALRHVSGLLGMNVRPFGCGCIAPRSTADNALGRPPRRTPRRSSASSVRSPSCVARTRS